MSAKEVGSAMDARTLTKKFQLNQERVRKVNESKEKFAYRKLYKKLRPIAEATLGTFILPRIGKVAREGEKRESIWIVCDYYDGNSLDENCRDFSRLMGEEKAIVVDGLLKKLKKKGFRVEEIGRGYTDDRGWVHGNKWYINVWW